jgi:bifunctional UDP-N-acetylglucosamine pyrophosphorylase / glucosamine-1-phosphate N-acetyltransferase
MLNMKTDFIILAAGKGKRMSGHVPKVLKILGGKPMVQHVVDTAKNFLNSKSFVVVGDRQKEVMSSLETYKDITWVKQRDQLGTGHAVKQTLKKLRNNSIAIVLYGDVPLVEPASLKKLIKSAQSNDLALLTMELDKPKGYGRIVRDKKGTIKSIVEEKDATKEQKKIAEVNTGIMAMKSNLLLDLIPKIKKKNKAGEYYLTDLVEITKSEQRKIKAITLSSPEEALGANSAEELHNLERVYQKRQALSLIKSGVRFGDINRFDVRGHLEAEKGCFVDVNCVFEGQVILEKNTNIGPNCFIKDSIIGEGSRLYANSVIEDSKLGKDCKLGPFARVRGGSALNESVEVGNFVEVNRSKIDNNVKTKHLTYLGDARIEKGANIGAGTITCNYDGKKKSITEIKEGAFIGSNSSLVAPVKVGKNAYTGAGSVITKNVPEESLAIARGKQVNIKKKK